VENPPSIQVFAPLVTGVEESPDILREINKINLSITPFGAPTIRHGSGMPVGAASYGASVTANPIENLSPARLRIEVDRAWRRGEVDRVVDVIWERARRVWEAAVEGLPSVCEPIISLNKIAVVDQVASAWERLQSDLAPLVGDLTHAATRQFPAVDGDALRASLTALIPSSADDLLLPLGEERFHQS